VFVRENVQTVTDVVELLNFVQDCIRMHGISQLSRNPKRENFRWADLVQET